MAGAEPEKGDKVSWNWGSGKPGGTVAEKKTEGDIAIKTKRGNIVKKNASADNPAIHIARSGNDVVKRASEVTVEKKASSGAATTNGKKREHEDDGDKEEATEPLKVNAEGKEIKPTAGKKQKTEVAKKEEKKEEVKEDKNMEETAPAPRKAGRPKKSEESKGKKKTPTPRSNEGIGSRTRSRK